MRLSIMATVSTDRLITQDRISSVLVTDFCPWANRYVYWLKEPIGWFLVAWAASILVGLYASTVGWVLASILGSVILVGMAWPWLAVRAVRCRLAPALDEIHEGQTCDLVLSVRNRFPLPLWGMAIEGYLDRHGDDARPTIALACVPMISEAEYRLAATPQLRGQYPVVPPQITCSMPFGLWTAKRPLSDHATLTVLPRVSRVRDEPERSGGRQAESGDGLRAGQAGEPLGVRDFRGGDRLRNVHWVHTARTGRLTVCERGAPQQQPIDIVLDPSLPTGRDAAHRMALRESLARRVRVAASLAVGLHAHHTPIRLIVGSTVLSVQPGSTGRRRLLTALADVPADGVPADHVVESPSACHGRVSLSIRGGSSAQPGVVVVETGRGLVRIEPNQSLDQVLARFWLEVNDVARVA